MPEHDVLPMEVWSETSCCPLNLRVFDQEGLLCATAMATAQAMDIARARAVENRSSQDDRTHDNWGDE